MIESIRKTTLSDLPKFRSLSKEAQSFISQCLSWDEDARPSGESATCGSARHVALGRRSDAATTCPTTHHFAW